MQLYKLANEWIILAEMAAEIAEGEDGVIHSDMISELDRIEATVDAKIAACCRVVRNLEASADACKAEADRLTARRKSFDANATRLKDYVKAVLESLGESRRQVDDVFTVRIQKNPVSVNVIDIDLVPREFDKILDRQVSISAIKEALKEGREVAGVELQQCSHLRIL